MCVHVCTLVCTAIPSSGMSWLLFGDLEVGIFQAPWHFPKLCFFAFVIFFSKEINEMAVGKSSGDSFEGFSWFLNAKAGREKEGNQEEWGKKGEKTEIRMEERRKQIVELKPYPSSVVLCSWVLWGR